MLMNVKAARSVETKKGWFSLFKGGTLFTIIRNVFTIMFWIWLKSITIYCITPCTLP